MQQKLECSGLASKVELNHLLTIEALSKQEITAILDRAQELIDKSYNTKAVLRDLASITVANLFFEPSTRTRCSFELAAKRLGAEVLNLEMGTSSMVKGETLIDTLQTIAAMDVQVLVIRHAQAGTAKFVADHFGTEVAIINGGDGHHEHPTQGLLDMLTIRQHKTVFDNLKVAIIGDIAHSRVARSDIQALLKLGVAELRLIAPESFITDDLKALDVSIYNDIDQGLKDVDVIMTLRIQKERMPANEFPNTNDFFKQFGVTAKRMQLAKPDAIVMHPGPMNRNVEIASEVADGKQSVILQQVHNGVAIRMAVLSSLTILNRCK